MAIRAGQPAGVWPRRYGLGLTVAVAVAAMAFTIAGCGTPAASARPDQAGVITAVGAENEYADVLSQIGGRYVRVSSVLNNPGADPHAFEASVSVAQEVGNASVIVQNGLGYDSWIGKMEAASPHSGRRVIVVQHLLGLPDSTPNPHLWYSPATMPKVARAVAADLAALQPAHAAYFRARLAAFSRSMGQLRAAIAGFKAAHPGTTAASTEPVAGYLLRAMGIINMTPFRFQAAIMNGTDPAPQDIALENSLLTEHKVKLFAYNQQVTGALTTSVRQTALNAGVPVVGVYETMPTPGFSYQSWMLAEVRAIEKAVVSKTSTGKLS
jgi:zinc/manganese transport system substrate-binding protein